MPAVPGTAPPVARRLALWLGVATAAWTAESLVYAAQIEVFGAQSGQRVAVGTALAQAAISGLTWVPFTVLALWLAVRWPVTARPAYVLLHLAGFAGLVLFRSAVTVAANPMLGLYPSGLPTWGRLLLLGVLNNLVYYVLLTGLAHAVFYRAAARASEARFAAARLQALTSQLQPHFLFNALNTIAAMIPDRPDAAERMVVDLAALLRFSVDRDSASLVPLEEEIGIGRAYLKIEEHRFADRLRVVVALDPTVRSAAVPPFILQPLLENAVRHGLAPRPGRTTLGIRAVRVGDSVEITVTDDGPGRRPGAGPSGVGLRNVRERLAATFGPQARLELSDREPSGLDARLVVPLRSASAAAAASAGAAASA